MSKYRKVIALNVDSSCVDAFAWEPQSEALSVMYKGNSYTVYTYLGVKRETVDALLSDDSIGRTIAGVKRRHEFVTMSRDSRVASRRHPLRGVRRHGRESCETLPTVIQ
jgi:hypothetical protein